MIRVYEVAVASVDQRLSKLVQSKGRYKLSTFRNLVSFEAHTMKRFPYLCASRTPIVRPSRLRGRDRWPRPLIHSHHNVYTSYFSNVTGRPDIIP